MVDHHQGSDVDSNHYWKQLSGLVWGDGEGIQELLCTKGKPGKETAVTSPQVEIKGFGAGHDFHTFPQHSMRRWLQPHWEDPHCSDPWHAQHLGSFILLFPSAMEAQKTHTTIAPN